MTIRSLIEQLGRVLEREHATERQQLLIRELSHRVGNSLAVVGSVFRLTAETSTSVADLRRRFEPRLNAVARADRALAGGEWSSASVENVVREALNPYCAQDYGNCDISGPDVYMPSRMVMALSLALHELAINAVKYGAMSASGGRVLVDWQVGREQHRSFLRLNWREIGGPRVRQSGRQGFGMQLIDSTIGHGLGGISKIDLHEQGLRAEFVIPYFDQEMRDQTLGVTGIGPV